MKGIDCTAQITPALAKALKANGVDFIPRYLVPEKYAWKRLVSSEVDATSVEDILLLSIFETTADRAKGGASAGQVDGKAAYEEAIIIGQPVNGPDGKSAIYFAVDYDAQPEDYDTLEAYFKAAKSQLNGYLIGGYGSYAVIEELFKRGAIDCGWQTYAWSHGKKSSHANVYQYKNGVKLCGIDCDMNESYGGEGFWKGESAVYKKCLVRGMLETVKLGSKGDAVRILQEELNFAGYNCVTVDGVFGTKTDKAVRLYQVDAGLKVDGVVGPKTWAELLTVYIVELSPEMLKAGLVSSPGSVIAKSDKNFINSNFFSGRSTIGWLISEGKILSRRDEYRTWHGNIKGTLIVYKDGRVEVGQKYDSEIAPAADTIQFCCQGFNLPAIGDVPASIRKEGFNPDEVGYRCNRLAIGYNGKNIIIAIQKLSNATMMRHIMEQLGCAGRSICLDSGGSVNLWVGGKAIFSTDRKLTNIVRW